MEERTLQSRRKSNGSYPELHWWGIGSLVTEWREIKEEWCEMSGRGEGDRPQTRHQVLCRSCYRSWTLSQEPQSRKVTMMWFIFKTIPLDPIWRVYWKGHEKKQGDQTGGRGSDPVGEDGGLDWTWWWGCREVGEFKRCLGVWGLTWGWSWDACYIHISCILLLFSVTLEKSWVVAYLFHGRHRR